MIDRRALRADLWLAQESPDPDILVVGVPNSKSSRSGADLGPLVLRERLRRFSTFDSETDLASVRIRDLGNWAVSELGPDALPEMLRLLATELPHAPLTVFLGGDGGITAPLAATLAEDPSRVGLVCFGQEMLDSSYLSSDNLVLIGARSFAGSEGGIGVNQVEEEGVAWVVDRALQTLDPRCDALYLHVDLGVLDSAFAPGSHASGPGGMTTRQLAAGARRFARHPKVRAMDLVGVDPGLDRDGITLDAAGYVLLSALAGFAER